MAETTGRYILFHALKCGSLLPLVALRALNIPHEVVLCDFKETTQKQGPNYERLLKVNPLAQFPTLITPEGFVMTEMTAIILFLQGRHSKGTLWDIHNLTTSQLAAFYRWLIFIPANFYPAVTIGEFPSRFVRVPVGGGVDTKTVEGWITAAANTRRGDMWNIMERNVPENLGDGIFVLGTHQPTFLDVLLALIAHFMEHVEDDFTWLPKTCPRLFRSVVATLEVEVVKNTFIENNFTQYLATKRSA